MGEGERNWIWFHIFPTARASLYQVRTINMWRKAFDCVLRVLHSNASPYLAFSSSLKIFKKIFYFVLEHSWSTLLCFRCTTKWFSYTCICSFSNSFPFWLLHNTEHSSLCYTVGPCCLSILNIAVCTCQSQIPNLSPPPFVDHLWFPLCKLS